MQILPYVLTTIPFAFLAYSYIIYPLALKVVSHFVPPSKKWEAPVDVPNLTITIPCYNEERSIGATIESVLALDYPRDRLQVLIVSDASTDRTDEIVRSYQNRGVELLRLEVRRGKTGAENAATPFIRGEIVMNTDATIRIVPGSLKKLVAAFQDPTVGVASGRDISVGDTESAIAKGESGYVGYEMWVRSLETRLGGIIGASGCFFASRVQLHDELFPEALSRDFASCLIAKEMGFRAVSVDEAQCLVPRARSIRAEFRRKVRTMARGLDTLYFKRAFLNPSRYGWFTVKLFSHKLSRWVSQLTLPLGVIGVILISIEAPWTDPIVLSCTATLGLIALASWFWPEGRRMPAILAVPGFFLWAYVAGFVAWMKFFLRERNPIWEPTRRAGVQG